VGGVVGLGVYEVEWCVGLVYFCYCDYVVYGYGVLCCVLLDYGWSALLLCCCCGWCWFGLDDVCVIDLYDVYDLVYGFYVVCVVWMV